MRSKEERRAMRSKEEGRKKSGQEDSSIKEDTGDDNTELNRVYFSIRPVLIFRDNIPTLATSLDRTRKQYQETPSSPDEYPLRRTPKPS